MVFKFLQSLFAQQPKLALTKEKLFEEFNILLKQYFSDTVLNNIKAESFSEGILNVSCRQEMAEKLAQRKQFFIEQINKKFPGSIKDIKFNPN